MEITNWKLCTGTEASFQRRFIMLEDRNIFISIQYTDARMFFFIALYDEENIFSFSKLLDEETSQWEEIKFKLGQNDWKILCEIICNQSLKFYFFFQMAISSLVYWVQRTNMSSYIKARLNQCTSMMHTQCINSASGIFHPFCPYN